MRTACRRRVAAGAGASRRARSRRRMRVRPAAWWWAAPPRSARPASNTRSTSPPSAPRSTGRASTSAASRACTFSQPSASAVTLNRVIGPDPSQIAGRIDANGQIILINQSGVIFYKGAQVNTAGLMVIAAGDQQPELHGRQAWCSTSPASPNAAVVNQGTITVEAGGAGGAGGAAGGEFRGDHGEAGPRGAGRGEDGDARSVWRRAAVARREQPGDAGADGAGRQAGDGAGDQHRA